VLLELNLDALIVPDVHEMQRSPALPYHLQCLLVLRVIEAEQLAVIYAEAVVPNMQNTLLRGALGFRRRYGAAPRVRNHTALDSVAAEGLAGTAEERSSGGAGRRLVVLIIVPMTGRYTVI